MLALRSILGGELPLGGEAEPLGVWRGTPYNVQRWKHKIEFHNRGVQWDTPMARWAGEENDWIKLLAQRKPRKEDVIRSLLESMKQAVEKKAQPNGTRRIKKPKDLPPLVLDIPEAGQRPTLEIKGDCTTIVDWINGHAKLKTRECTVAKTQNLLRDWWGRGVHLRQRTAEWATHIFREHNKEADTWAGKGAKGHVHEWVDTARMSCGPRSSVSVGFGMAVVTTAIVGPV